MCMFCVCAHNFVISRFHWNDNPRERDRTTTLTNPTIESCKILFLNIQLPFFLPKQRWGKKKSIACSTDVYIGPLKLVMAQCTTFVENICYSYFLHSDFSGDAAAPSTPLPTAAMFTDATYPLKYPRSWAGCIPSVYSLWKCWKLSVVHFNFNQVLFRKDSSESLVFLPSK